MYSFSPKLPSHIYVCKYIIYIIYYKGFPGGSAGKESACNVGDLGLIPGLGRSPGEGKGYPLQYTGLENSMGCIVRGVARSRTPLSDLYFHFHFLHEKLHTRRHTQTQWNWLALALNVQTQILQAEMIRASEVTNAHCTHVNVSKFQTLE